MADEPGTPPARHPRRRRSDFDPSFIGPKVARERRRSANRPTSVRPGDRTAPRPGSSTSATPSVTSAVTPAPSGTVPAPMGALSASAPAPGGPRPWLASPDDRSPNPAICPFLRAVHGDELGPPIESPDEANRCAALAEPVPQSLRQQSLVCQTAGHVNCPRYLRGAAALPVAATVRTGPSVSPAIAASAIAVIGAFVLSIGFVASRGGMEIAAVATPSPVASAPAVVVGSPGATGTAVEPSASTAAPATASSPLSPSASPTPVPSSTPSPTPTPKPSAAPTRTPRPTATSDRYALLVACPNTPKCWIYTVRSGDNLYSIAHYFGVSEARLRSMNPWLAEQGLRAGQKLRMPPPTR